MSSQTTYKANSNTIGIVRQSPVRPRNTDFLPIQQFLQPRHHIVFFLHHPLVEGDLFVVKFNDFIQRVERTVFVSLVTHDCGCSRIRTFIVVLDINQGGFFIKIPYRLELRVVSRLRAGVIGLQTISTVQTINRNSISFRSELRVVSRLRLT